VRLVKLILKQWKSTFALSYTKWRAPLLCHYIRWAGDGAIRGVQLRGAPKYRIVVTCLLSHLENTAQNRYPMHMLHTDCCRAALDRPVVVAHD
jgi:hypothetical protein